MRNCFHQLSRRKTLFLLAGKLSNRSHVTSGHDSLGQSRLSMNKLLALNRGEIAIRILRAASELGLRTVAVYSQEDRLSLHRFKADEAYLIGKDKGPVQAYLDVWGIVAMAREKGVDAIHPGYGFLAENPELPNACREAGITFVGPSADLLQLLGDKTAARRLAQKAGVPVIPGTEDPVTDTSVARRVAAEIGFPLIVKAAFGGGGRGMRIVASESEFEAKIAEARQEAAAAFGNDAGFPRALYPESQAHRSSDPWRSSREHPPSL